MDTCIRMPIRALSELHGLPQTSAVRAFAVEKISARRIRACTGGSWKKSPASTICMPPKGRAGFLTALATYSSCAKGAGMHEGSRAAAQEPNSVVALLDLVCTKETMGEAAAAYGHGRQRLLYTHGRRHRTLVKSSASTIEICISGPVARSTGRIGRTRRCVRQAA